jgi:glycerophosphoryl diester phosphodiesterase
LQTEQIVIISFNPDVIRECKSARPEHKAYWLSGFWENQEGIVVPTLEEVIKVLNETGADGFSSHHGRITPEFIAGIKDQGYEYHVWTVNDPARAHELIQQGAMSVTTDVPLLVKEYLKKKEDV